MSTKKLPFSVLVIDMDWHNVGIDPKYGTGWTGFSWNTELYPDYKEEITKILMFSQYNNVALQEAYDALQNDDKDTFFKKLITMTLDDNIKQELIIILILLYRD